jgi:lipopolysaccharide transport system permease protein
MKHASDRLDVQRLIYLRDLLRELVIRDLKVRYKSSVLGFAWALVTPLMYLTVFYFLFKVSFSLAIPRFGPYAFTGMLVYTWFQSSVSQASGAITDNPELIKWPGFAAAILPIVTVTTNLIHFLFAMPLLMLFLIFDGTGTHNAVFLLPIVVAIQFVLTLGLGYLVAAGNVLFHDTQHVVAVLLQLLFFLTPVFYDASLVPERYQSIYRLNPMVHLVEAYRAILLDGAWPGALNLLTLGALAAALLYIGHGVFVHLSYRFVDEV